MTNVPSDLKIAQGANKRPIIEVAAELGIPSEDLIPYGHDKAKIGYRFLEDLDDRPDGKLILVTAISPTPAGEGKTTTTVGLGDGLCKLGKKAIICLREPSLGPCFGMKGGAVVVAINQYQSDTVAEHEVIKEFCRGFGVDCVVATHWENGGEGARVLAEHVVKMIEHQHSQFRTLYADDLSLWNKARRIARSLYGAEDIIADKKVRAQFQQFEQEGYGHFPVCMAKTQYSFSTDPLLLGAPSGHDVPIREIRLAKGAEFVVVVCGDIMTMPGLPRKPSSENISVNDEKRIVGLF